MSDEKPAIREGLWDCPNCSNANRGRDTSCSGCGQQRENVEFYLPDDAKAVEDAEVAARARSGPDWVCAYCETSNGGGNKSCVQCGAGADEGKNREQKVILDKPAAPAAPAGAAATAASTGASAGAGAGADAGGGGGGAAKLGIIGMVVLALLCVVCGGIGVLAFRTSEEQATVTAMSWERSIQVEERRWVKEDGWDLPRDARLIRKGEEKKGTKKVQTGTEKVKVGKKDLGNGFFEDVYEDKPVYKEEPVYATKYYYEVQRWFDDRTERSKGSGTDGLRWPDVRIGPNEREGTRTQTYKVTVQTAKDKKTYDYAAKDEASYKRFTVGSKWVAVINGLGSVTELKAPGSKK